MSKKLIAVASAAALALSAFVATPAMAAPFSVTVLGEFGTTAGTTATDAIVVNAPSQDVLRFDNTDGSGVSTTGTVIRFDVVTTVGSAGVTATATGGVKLLTAAQAGASEADLEDLTTASGTASITDTTTTGATVSMYAYATSTTAGTVTITQNGTSNSTVLFVKAKSEKTNSYKLNFTVTPATAAGADVTFTGTITDMFGNLMTLDTADLVVDGIGGNLATPIATRTDFAVNSTTKVHTWKMKNRDTNGAAAMLVKLNSSTAQADEVTAFGDRVTNQFFNVTAVDLAAQVTALTAQVAALQAIVDRKVTKKRYNTLARKWNRAFPSQKVWVKP
jgi:hypothetical protein